MQLIDSHTHLYLPEFNDDREEVVRRALDVGITGLLLPNIDKDSYKPMLKMVDNYPGICYAMTGIHPTYIKDDYREQLETMEKSLSKNAFVAIGEIGIDLYWDKTYIKEQEIAFREQLAIAGNMNLPVVIHTRNSLKETLRIIDEQKSEGLKGVFHAFTGTVNEAEEIISRGFMIGIGGILTFKNSGLDKTIQQVDLQNIILETDSPYLAPVPKRGKRNESSYLRFTAEYLAGIKGLSPEETARQTSSNCRKLFNLD